MESPMDILFSWPATPSCTQASGSNKTERKCQDDSGYVTPYSDFKSKGEFSLETPTPGNDTGFESSEIECISPFSKSGKAFRTKSRLNNGKCFSTLERGTSSYLMEEVDSFSEFLCGETSLYTDGGLMMDSKPRILSSPPDNKTIEKKCEESHVGKRHLSVEETIVSPVMKTERLGQVKDEAMEIDTTFSLMSAPSVKGFTCPDRLWCSGKRFHSTNKGSSEPKIHYRYNTRRRLLSSSQKSSPTLSLLSNKLDIIYQLCWKSNQTIALTKILDYLSPSDISSMTMVSKGWRGIALGHSRTRGRWENYVAERKRRKENLVPRSSISFHGVKLGLLVERNHSTPLRVNQATSPPVSPSKIKFNLFQKAAKKLKNGEFLMRCPRCSSPSVCTSKESVGACVKLDCGLKFCSICLRDFHEGGVCDGYFSPTSTTPTKKRPIGIGSKESRKLLKRL